MTKLELARAICGWMPPLIAQRVRTLIYSGELRGAHHTTYMAPAITGSWLPCEPFDYPCIAFSVNGYFDWRNVAIAAALAGPGDTIVEVGANVGTETTCFADIVGGTGSVLAIEPDPGCSEKLRRLIASRSDTTIKLFECALSSKEGMTRFKRADHSRNSGMGFICSPESGQPDKDIAVPCRTLDSLILSYGAVSAVFIDVEGHELEVLRGGRHVIHEHHPPIVLEASPKLLRRAGESLETLAQLLSSMDYLAHEISRFGIRTRVDLGSRRATNWLCVHKSTTSAAASASRMIRRAGLLPVLGGLNPLSSQSARIRSAQVKARG